MELIKLGALPDPGEYIETKQKTFRGYAQLEDQQGYNITISKKGFKTKKQAREYIKQKVFELYPDINTSQIIL